MAVKNTMKLIEKSIGYINTNYDMSISNIEEIKMASENFYDLICNGFRLGYLQGMKAAKAEAKKRGVAND